MPLNKVEDRPTVFAIIPTFNRFRFTRVCIQLLMGQTHQPVVIIVSDGGSTDGTRENIRQHFPEVVLVYDNVDRWWAGSTALGVAEALRRAKSGDYLLLINNDTEIPADYVETLVAISAREGGAAVGAKIVDSRDHDVVLDAGEFIDWERYIFPVKDVVGAGETFCGDVDVLPGRGSLVPVEMMKRVGNVDDAAFPHYLSDYDLFCRLKKAGCKLGVTYETYIAAHIEETGIKPSASKLSFADTWKELFSRRSMSNVVDHWRFVGRHAPTEHRGRIHGQIFRGVASRLFWASPLGATVGPLARARDKAWNFSKRRMRKPAQFLFLPRPLTDEEIRDAGFDVAELLAVEALTVTPVRGWYRTMPLSPESPAKYHKALRRLMRVAAPFSFRKVERLMAFRRALHSLREGGSEARS